MNNMRRIMPWVALVSIFAALPVMAALCPKCKDLMVVQALGTCVECKGTTSSSTYQLCGKCSDRLGECESCRVKLAALAKPDRGVAAPSVKAADSAVTVPAASGWKITNRDRDICSITSDTKIARRWQSPFFGSGKQGFDIIRDQGALDALWKTFPGSPVIEAPKIDFDRQLLVVIQPGDTITQYNYKLNIHEGPASLDFKLSEFHTSKDSRLLLAQAAILAFELPKTSKEIKVDIQRAPGSEGPYDK